MGERFRFDAGIISAFADEWNTGQLELSQMILPRHSREWAHQSVALPTYSGQPAHVIDLIIVQGEDDLDHIDLLKYPFIAHELGHNALFRQGAVFSEAFNSQLQKHLNVMLRQSLADRGGAKNTARETVEQIGTFWSATPNHFNWAHEIAADVIALWACGPAYLAAFDDVLADPIVNPYQIGQSHPPYELRAKALIQGADKCGWTSEGDKLSGRVKEWRSSKWKQERNNHYVALASPLILTSCVDIALQTCDKLRVPKCTPGTIRALLDKLKRTETPELGSELLLAAYLVREKSTEAAYEGWERKVIRTHLASIML